MSRVPVVFTQEQIDAMANKPFDVYDNKIRQSMADFQTKIDAINERMAAFNESKQKWTSNEHPEPQEPETDQ